jgi:hypothetical protein
MDKNVFRTEYRELTESEKQDVDLLKFRAEMMWELMKRYGEGRHMSIAKTHLETAVMFAVKEITG